jgi:DNA-binding NtrC family response regulator
MQGSILIVDDEVLLGDALRRALVLDGHAASYCSDAEEALRVLRSRPFDVLLTDLVMPGIDGIEVLRRAKRIRPSCEVVVMTAFATVDTARAALKRGAVDYLTKPFSVEQELLPVIRALLATPGGAEGEVAPSDAALEIEGIVAASPTMRALVEKLPRIARSRASVLLRGDSGTGKEVVASALHRLSERAARPASRRAPTPARTPIVRGSSRWPTAARCSSTRSVSCRARSRRSCCGCSRTASSTASASPGVRCGWTCA